MPQVVDKKAIAAAKCLSGPHVLFDKSFILEFLEPPPELDATVLMRTTYTGHLQSQGKNHPQSPPLHVHFDQLESFFVGKGRVGTTDGWGAEDRIWDKDMVGLPGGVHVIDKWIPHRFWPVPTSTEDSVIYLWAHPEAVPEPLDRLFFENLLRYLSDVAEKKASLNLFQLMLMQHVTATALLIFPTAWWLGPLRWWVPWKVQGIFAWFAVCFGYKALMREYTPEKDWEEFIRTKKA